MGREIRHQISKEFQLKIDPQRAYPTAQQEPTQDDAAYEQVLSALGRALRRIAGSTVDVQGVERPWSRIGVRYDTQGGLLCRQGLSLASEATQDRAEVSTKLKCKLHGFIPELLLETPEKSLCYPHWPDDVEGGKAKLKLEQDIHFNNTKYCVSGSLRLKVGSFRPSTLADFIRFYPALATLSGVRGDTALEPVSVWQEKVYGKFVSRGQGRERQWDLVVRRRWATAELVESELSFKHKKPWDAPWDRSRLAEDAAIYRSLQQEPLFLAHPEIFYFQDPVRSVPWGG